MLGGGGGRKGGWGGGGGGSVKAQQHGGTGFLRWLKADFRLHTPPSMFTHTLVGVSTLRQSVGQIGQLVAMVTVLPGANVHAVPLLELTKP